MFLGKGGVGKTTCAAATAVQIADAGKSALAISTDPTPSLSHIFGLEGGRRERQVLPRLFITELGLAEVRAMWDERFGREVYAVFSSFVDIDYPTFVQFVTSLLPGLNEEFMVDYIRRLSTAARYQHILWDTAPLGQTLALLAMPTLLAEHLRIAPRIYSQLRASVERKETVMQVIRGWQQLAAACLEFLRRDVRFSMVTIPEALAVAQLDSVIGELQRHGLSLHRLIVNNVVQLADSAFLTRKAEQQRPHLERLRQRYGSLPLVEIPLFSEEPRGIEQLRTVGRLLWPAP
ncbi:MAG TPA: ArsA family ATPase [Steroidobacteraceae bacterium]|nr:ArsA family ATPase [Steroidobacteraceae bacterium]